MIILAIDPGAVTGISWWAGLDIDTKPYVEEIPGGLYGFVDWWGQNADPDVLDLVVVEDFIIKADTHKKTRQSDAYELVGWIKGKCHEQDIPIDVFGAGEHTSFTDYKVKKRSKLVRLGWSVPSPDMHMDSASSLLLLGMKRHDRATADRLLKEIATHA